MTDKRKVNWEAVLNQVMKKDSEYRFMEIVRKAAEKTGLPEQVAQASISWLLGTNRSGKYTKVRRGVYVRQEK